MGYKMTVMKEEVNTKSWHGLAFDKLGVWYEAPFILTLQPGQELGR
jgi:hypothetical protein